MSRIATRRQRVLEGSGKAPSAAASGRASLRLAARTGAVLGFERGHGVLGVAGGRFSHGRGGARPPPPPPPPAGWAGARRAHPATGRSSTLRRRPCSRLDPSGVIPVLDFHVEGEGEVLRRPVLRVRATPRARAGDAFLFHTQLAVGADAYELLAQRPRLLPLQRQPSPCRGSADLRQRSEASGHNRNR
jgi:hypothetical protein